MIAITRKTLCGHDDARAMFSDLSGEATICQPCFRLAKAARDDYLTGHIGYRQVQALMAPLLGDEAQTYCRALRWSRIKTRLGVR